MAEEMVDGKKSKKKGGAKDYKTLQAVRRQLYFSLLSEAMLLLML